MECKVCGTVNADDAIFCKHCGVRMDGKKTCKICGTENDCDARFCNKCGKVLVDGAASTAAVADENQEIILQTAKPSNWKRILEIIGWACAMTGLFFSFLFTFFIGVETRTFGSDISYSGESRSLFYFLSKAYENIATDAAKMQAGRFAQAYLPLFLATLIAVAVLVTVVVLTIVSIVRFVKYVRGKSNRDFAKVTVATYLVFVMGSVMLLGLTSLLTRYVSSTLTVTGGSITLTSVNVAGILLGGLCMFSFVGLRVAVKGKQLALRENILKIIFGGVFIVISNVLLGILPSGAICANDVSSYGTETISGSFFSILSMIYRANGSLTEELIISTFAHLVQIVMIVLVIVNLLNQIENNIGTKTKSSLGFTIAILVLAVSYLSLAIIFNTKVFGDASTQVNLIYTTPIVILIFAMFNLAAAITQKVISKNVQAVPSADVTTVSAE